MCVEGQSRRVSKRSRGSSARHPWRCSAEVQGSRGGDPPRHRTRGRGPYVRACTRRRGAAPTRPTHRGSSDLRRAPLGRVKAGSPEAHREGGACPAGVDGQHRRAAGAGAAWEGAEGQGGRRAARWRQAAATAFTLWCLRRGLQGCAAHARPRERQLNAEPSRQACSAAGKQAKCSRPWRAAQEATWDGGRGGGGGGGGRRRRGRRFSSLRGVQACGALRSLTSGCPFRGVTESWWGWCSRRASGCRRRGGRW